MRNSGNYLPMTLDGRAQPLDQEPKVPLRERRVLGVMPDEIPRLDRGRLARCTEQRRQVAQAFEDRGRGDACGVGVRVGGQRRRL